jgi:hypothetical protein
MASKIQLRRDLAASWTSTNPVLAQGEPGFETDTGLFKIGDGVTAWMDLTYAGGNSTGGTSEQWVGLLGIQSGGIWPGMTSISQDGDNWTAPTPVVHWYGAGVGSSTGCYLYNLAVGGGKVVYLVEFEDGEYSGYSGIASATTAFDSPLVSIQDCTYSTPDGDRYPVYWENIQYVNGYFVATGSYDTFNSFPNEYLPCFIYSQDGVNWTWGNVDQTFISSLISNNSGNDSDLGGMTLEGVSYNGVGYVLGLSWYTYGPTGTPNNAGAYYITGLDQACNSSSWFQAGGAQYSYGNIQWTGNAWVATDFQTNIFTNVSKNPTQGTWTTISINDAAMAAFGDDNSYIEYEVYPSAGVLNGVDWWIYALEDGRILATNDGGVTWEGFTFLPAYDQITEITQASPAVISVNSGLQSNQVKITGLPVGTFGTGANAGTYKGGSGTFYVDQGSGQLYSDVNQSVAVTSGASFNQISVSVNGVQFTDNTCIVDNLASSGILVGMALYFDSSYWQDDDGPTIVTGINTTTNTVTFSNPVVANDDIDYAYFGPAVSYSTSYWAPLQTIIGGGKLVIVSYLGGEICFLSTEDLVNYNYSFGYNFTNVYSSYINPYESDWGNGYWDTDYAPALAYGEVGNVANLLISNNSLGTPPQLGFLENSYWLPHSQTSGVSNSLSVGDVLQANLFGYNDYVQNGAVINQNLLMDPNTGLWSIGTTAISGLGQQVIGSNYANVANISNGAFYDQYYSFDYSQGGLTDVLISVGSNPDLWWFTAATTSSPSLMVMPQDGAIAVLNPDGDADNALRITYWFNYLNEPNIAIGPQAGANPAGGNMIAIGYEAGKGYQDNYAIALGARAGKFGQGVGAIAIGAFAAGQWGTSGTAQSANSIIINATANQSEPLYDAGAGTFVVKPIRGAVETTTALYYNSSTGEITYGQGTAKTNTAANTGISGTPSATALNGNLVFQISNTGYPAVAVTTIDIANCAWSGTIMVNGVQTTFSSGTSTYTTLTTSSSAQLTSTVLANPGDYSQVIFQDIDFNNVYRVTFTAQTSAYGAVIVEQLI